MRRINEYRLVIDKVVMAQCILRTYLARRAFRNLRTSPLLALYCGGSAN
jgi:hypothetical protein